MNFFLYIGKYGSLPCVYILYNIHQDNTYSHTIVSRVTQKYLMKRQLEDVEIVTGSDDEQRSCDTIKKSLVYVL